MKDGFVFPDGLPPGAVIAVVGPTATGKTALGVSLARHLDTEVISADSQLVYRELDIGTAKPSAGELQGVPHHMIDVAAPDEAFSVAMYQARASAHLDRLRAEGRIPVVVGGTGFYIRALLEAEFIPDTPPNPAFRQRMNALADAEGSPALHRLLEVRDPGRAADLHPNDRFRLIRALEIVEATGRPVSRQARRKDIPVLWIGLDYDDRALLDARINTRIERMLAAGWLDEAADLVRRYGRNAHALGVAHGYPELVRVAAGECDLESAVERIRINVRQYARRQMTWFRRNPAIRWRHCDRLSSEALLDEVIDILPLSEVNS
jgi:tRNA dimethylallyltransferase